MLFSKEKSERINNEIVKLLQEDGRRTYNSVAGAIGISVQNATERIQTMLNQGLISIYGTVKPDQSDSAMTVFFAMVVEKPHIRDVIKELSSHRSMILVLRTAGRYDLLARANFRSTREYIDYIEQMPVQLEGVKSFTSFVCANIYRGIYRRVNPYLIDSEDRDLIALLMKDGRQSNNSLATKLGLSPSGVGRRIKNLLDSQTVRITTAINISQQHQYAAFLISVDLSKINETAEILSQRPEVLFLATTAGKYNIYGNIMYSTTNELDCFMSESIYNIQGLQEFELFQVLESEWLYDSIFEKYWQETH